MEVEKPFVSAADIKETENVIVPFHFNAFSMFGRIPPHPAPRGLGNNGNSSAGYFPLE